MSSQMPLGIKSRAAHNHVQVICPHSSMLCGRQVVSFISCCLSLLFVLPKTRNGLLLPLLLLFNLRLSLPLGIASGIHRINRLDRFGMGSVSHVYILIRRLDLVGD